MSILQMQQEELFHVINISVFFAFVENSSFFAWQTIPSDKLPTIYIHRDEKTTLN